jgi:hypothetical protein
MKNQQPETSPPSEPEIFPLRRPEPELDPAQPIPEIPELPPNTFPYTPSEPEFIYSFQTIRIEK